MFDSLKGYIRKVGIKLGIIKKLENLTDHKRVSLPASFYEKIIQWRELHRGYYAPLHDVYVHTIANGKEKRCMNTLNMPKVISNEIASLIFNERCEIAVSDEGYNQFIAEVLKDNKFNGKFQNFLEYTFAEGGGVIKPYVKDGKIKLSYVTADCFLPISWDNSGIREGVFVSEIKNQGKNYTHLEWHTFEGANYVITNELYESQLNEDLGSKVSLSTLFPEIEPRVVLNDVQRPLFAYFAPAIANNVDSTIPLGISIYANSYDTLKAIDTMFDSYVREFRLGKKRIVVPAQMVKTVHNPQTGEFHRYFDSSDETYEALPGNMDQDYIKDISTELRVEEHIAAINSMLNLLALQVGFSQNAFTFNGNSMKTATEVVSENSKTFRTKQSHENVIEQSIDDLIRVIDDVAFLYGIYNVTSEYDVTVTFDDSIAQDRTSDIQEQILLVGSGLQSKIRAIRKIYGVNDDEAALIYQEIRDESLNEAPSFQEFQSQALFGGGVE